MRNVGSKIGLKEIWATGSILDGNSSGRFFRDHLSGKSEVDGIGTLYKVYGIGDDDLPYRYFSGPKKSTATKGKYYQGIPRKVLDNLDNIKKSQPIVTFMDLAGNFGNCRHEGGVDFRSGKKPIELFRKLFGMVVSEKNDLILDFFSGSASTAHAVMQLNSEDSINRKFIMVQIPEDCFEKSGAFKTIAEIGKERIRRAGQKIKAENPLNTMDLDIGFRVLKVDSSNMNDVYYSPDVLDKANLASYVSNIHEDRSDEDLLFQVLLDWGVDLTLPIQQQTIEGKPVFIVAENVIAACFDREGGITEAFIKQLAEIKPLRAVFCDAGFASDSVKINVEQIFKLLSPNTELKTL
ncbi:DNA methyltransferase [Crenothrix polyspora]|uniref:Methyltransferase n=1 Tax=Crenothrix polyspora TaxID=360316 RepID=A0A1R4H0Y8_9GAMM